MHSPPHASRKTVVVGGWGQAQRCQRREDHQCGGHPGDRRAVLRAARAVGAGLREDYMAHRPHVERAIAQIATWRIKLRYRGEAKNNA
jgi:hypothetical protein